jgi:hypothetical protein
MWASVSGRRRGCEGVGDGMAVVATKLENKASAMGMLSNNLLNKSSILAIIDCKEKLTTCQS